MPVPRFAEAVPVVPAFRQVREQEQEREREREQEREQGKRVFKLLYFYAVF